ncbi:hypothetical protein V4762_00010 [Thermodesulfobium sp. 4217-1]|uniref:Uncharacterized protein n=1 Tax=Thermodesulfobium acidiphilum TaxID=1794699 RepID=A0A2R4W2K6_THEAF|nr:hypothetical protein [Thermodesulfobium acidiphilum]AWB11013.1 hypothetical protein TDSAC_1677 [Thermodesulfobium acidiphilum]
MKSLQNCSKCSFFMNDPGKFEKTFPGFTVLSSAYGSTRADAGLCMKNDRIFLPSRKACKEFVPK